MPDTKFIKTEVHPAFLKFMQLCADINFGHIDRVQIQDGIPVLIETTEGAIVLPGAKITKKTKLV